MTCEGQPERGEHAPLPLQTPKSPALAALTIPAVRAGAGGRSLLGRAQILLRFRSGPLSRPHKAARRRPSPCALPPPCPRFLILTFVFLRVSVPPWWNVSSAGADHFGDARKYYSDSAPDH